MNQTTLPKVGNKVFCAFFMFPDGTIVHRTYTTCIDGSDACDQARTEVRRFERGVKFLYVVQY